MKRLTLALFAFCFCIALYAQNTDTTATPRVEDPTQIFTYVDFSAGINFVNGSYGIEPNNWALNYRAVLGSKRFRTGFTLPFSNFANTNTGLGDIGIDFGYKLHQSTGIYTATTLNAGVFFPTSYNDYSSNWDTTSLGQDRPFFTFFANYTSSLKMNNAFYLYPKIEIYKRTHIAQTTMLLNNPYIAPNITQSGFRFELGASYRFNAKHFLYGYVQYQPERWAIVENGFAYRGPSTYNINRINWGLRYQFNLNPQNQMYLRLDGTVRGTNLPNLSNYGTHKDSYFIRFGFKHFFKL